MTISTAPARSVELGVFLPVGSGGWITSTTSPQLPATYQYNLDVTVLAEELGFDFALSMAKWRGYGGESKHWDTTLESISTMAGIAQATSRINVWATVHTMVFHPAVIAKMGAVIDQISHGRFGLNIVAGSNPADQGQFGLWRDLDHAGRYALAEEWITVAKRLWTEERVDFDGEYFTLTDCVSDPKPAKLPPVICAGGSDRGFKFTIDNCTGSLLQAGDTDKHIALARRAKEIAAESDKPDFKTYGLFTVVTGDTDADAQARVDSYNAGVDMVALANQAREYGTDTAKENTSAKNFIQAKSDAVAVGTSAIVGSPETVARRLAYAVREGQLDGVTIIVPEFIDDLRTFGEQVMPFFEEYGVSTSAATFTRA
ncbi:LLM class flavin-dependent oxidoreductase [Glaciihabitans sp. dw_435]|uniref:LLM class flavin-dependent oxidoreductase n=1 Tax=Glaciihabitans sp. dw_435 TaxID=2720081 RepID=UPI001BD4C7F2|nr:LLM class flavin-dependent oxidoreductase [Glaciihabitans sp. dw_435]